MKKSIKLATILVAGAMMLVSCGGDGFKTTDSGLQYKFEKQNKSAQQVQDGDVLVGEMTVTPTAYCRPRRPSTETSTRAC